MSDPKVIIYSSPTCAFCHMAKEYLKGKKVDFKETDISQDMDAAQWVFDNVGQLATPVIDIHGTIVLGFDRPRIDAALAQHKLAS